MGGQQGYNGETPYPVALVELELPSENPSGQPVRMTSHIVDCEPDGLTLGMPVAVTFRQIADEPLVNLPVFRPQEE